MSTVVGGSGLDQSHHPGGQNTWEKRLRDQALSRSAVNTNGMSGTKSMAQIKKALFQGLVEAAPKQDVHHLIHTHGPKLASLGRSRHYEDGKLVFPESKENQKRANSALDKYFNPDPRMEAPDPMWLYNKKVQLRDKIRQHTSGGPSEIRQSFRDFDANANGVIDSKEFRSFCNRMNLMLDKKEGLQLFQSFDVDHDGRVDFYEFVDKILNESDFKRPNGGGLRGKDRLARANLAKQLLENEQQLVQSREKLLDHEMARTGQQMPDMTDEDRKSILYSSPRHTHLIPIGSRGSHRSRNGASHGSGVAGYQSPVLPSARSVAKSGRRSSRPASVPLPETGGLNVNAAAAAAAFNNRPPPSGAGSKPPSGAGSKPPSGAGTPLNATLPESAASYTSVDLRKEKRKYVKKILSELLTMDQRVEENEALFKDVLTEISKDRLSSILDKVLSKRGSNAAI